MKELIEIQNELKVPKTEFNKFGGYKYRTLDTIFAGLKPILHRLNCQLLLSDEIVLIGTRYYVKATATLINLSGESVSNSAYARESDIKKGTDDPMLTGTASTYARKYALNGMFCMDDNQDPDATCTFDKEDKKVKSVQPTPAPVQTSAPAEVKSEADAIAVLQSAQSMEDLASKCKVIKDWLRNKNVILAGQEMKKKLTERA